MLARRRNELLNAIEHTWLDDGAASNLRALWKVATSRERSAATDYLLNVGGVILDSKRSKSGLMLALDLFAVDRRSPAGLAKLLATFVYSSKHRCLAVEARVDLPVEIRIHCDSADWYDPEKGRQTLNRRPEHLKVTATSQRRLGVPVPDDDGDLPDLGAIWNNPLEIERVLEASPGPGRAVLLELSKHPDGRVRMIIAHTYSDREILATLIQASPLEDAAVFGEVFLSPTTPSELIELAYQRHRPSYASGSFSAPGPLFYRDGWAARNENSPRKLLTYLHRFMLKCDKEHRFLLGRYLSENRSTPAPILARLAREDDVEARNNVAANLSTRAETVRQLCGDSSERGRDSCAVNPMCCPEWL